MKRILTLIFTCAALVWSGQTLYGPSGYTFVPDGFVDHNERYGGYFAGEYVGLERIRMYPKFVGFHVTLLSDRLDFSVASTYSFVTKADGYHPQKVGDGLLPICPAVKWSIADVSKKWVRWGYVAGAMAPYGAFGAATVRATLPILQPEFTMSIATTFVSTSYGMLGGRLRLADLDGKPLPLSFVGEGGWAGSMSGKIGETKEAFVSFGTEIDMGRNLTWSVHYRKDPSIYKDPETNAILAGQNQGGRWNLKLDYHFDGVKQVAKETP